MNATRSGRHRSRSALLCGTVNERFPKVPLSRRDRVGSKRGLAEGDLGPLVTKRRGPWPLRHYIGHGHDDRYGQINLTGITSPMKPKATRSRCLVAQPYLDQRSVAAVSCQAVQPRRWRHGRLVCLHAPATAPPGNPGGPIIDEISPTGAQAASPGRTMALFTRFIPCRIGDHPEPLG